MTLLRLTGRAGSMLTDVPLEHSRHSRDMAIFLETWYLHVMTGKTGLPSKFIEADG